MYVYQLAACLVFFSLDLFILKQQRLLDSDFLVPQVKWLSSN